MPGSFRRLTKETHLKILLELLKGIQILLLCVILKVVQQDELHLAIYCWHSYYQCRGWPGQHFTQDDIKDYLKSKGIKWEKSADLMEVASKSDVIYKTRTQQERFGGSIDLYEEGQGKYIMDRCGLNVAQKLAVVMYPLPRLDEINVDANVDPRAADFRRAKNGLHIRMALLKLLFVE